MRGSGPQAFVRDLAVAVVVGVVVAVVVEVGVVAGSSFEVACFRNFQALTKGDSGVGFVDFAVGFKLVILFVFETVAAVALGVVAIVVVVVVVIVVIAVAVAGTEQLDCLIFDF